MPSTAANAVAALALFAFAFAVSLVATVQLCKHRLFDDIRVAELRDIERRLALFGVQAFGVQPFPVLFTTDNVKAIGADSLCRIYKTKLGLFTYRSAFQWLYGLMIGVSVTFLTAAIIVPILFVLGAIK